MASNPIQRRARQSFLMGFLIALIIMAAVAALLFMKINSLNNEIKELEIAETTVYTAGSDIKSGEVITSGMLTAVSVRTEIDTSGYITSADLSQVDSDGNSIEYVAKIDITSGSLITPEMVSESDNLTSDDDRIVEYNMISLPSQLENGDYVDIRLSLPNGQSYIVLSKKYVEQTTTTGIWMTMSELDILSLNSAIVESYWTEGSNLYAVQYTEPGLQEAATETYAVNESVLTLINSDPNILEDAKSALAERIYSDYETQRDTINGLSSGLDDEDKSSAVSTGVSTENSAINEDREEYVTNLEGTGLVGSN